MKHGETVERNIQSKDMICIHSYIVVQRCLQRSHPPVSVNPLPQATKTRYRDVVHARRIGQLQGIPVVEDAKRTDKMHVTLYGNATSIVSGCTKNKKT